LAKFCTVLRYAAFIELLREKLDVCDVCHIRLYCALIQHVINSLKIVPAPRRRSNSPLLFVSNTPVSLQQQQPYI
jgi:hypothetical protein